MIVYLVSYPFPPLHARATPQTSVWGGGNLAKLERRQRLGKRIAPVISIALFARKDCQQRVTVIFSAGRTCTDAEQW